MDNEPQPELDDALEDLEVTEQEAVKVEGGKKLPGKRKPPTLTL